MLPVLAYQVILEGSLVTARLIGSLAYVAVSTAPRLPEGGARLSEIPEIDVMPWVGGGGGGGGGGLEPAALCADVSYVAEAQYSPSNPFHPPSALPSLLMYSAPLSPALAPAADPDRCSRDPCSCSLHPLERLITRPHHAPSPPPSPRTLTTPSQVQPRSLLVLASIALPSGVLKHRSVVATGSAYREASVLAPASLQPLTAPYNPLQPLTTSYSLLGPSQPLTPL